MRTVTKLVMLLTSFLSASCQCEPLEFTSGDLSVNVEGGDGWLHNYPLFLEISKKNPPQVAIWMEDADGNYLTTIYASRKIATQGWNNAKGNRRSEALPHWSYQRGVMEADGLYLPTKQHPLVDGMTGATPKGSFDIRVKEKTGLRHFYIKVEVNHSIDFNEYYPENAIVGDSTYSGGSEGSGQPALVYMADIDLDSGFTSFEAFLVGHSSPDGSDGRIHEDMKGITSALNIVKRIIVCLK